MLFELIAVFTAGLVTAGVILLVRRIVPALPRWLAPSLAGVAMLATAISLEYSWYQRTRASLPEGMEVALTQEERAPWRPWTYAAPYVDRFIAVNGAGARTNPDLPGQRMVDIYAFARWSPVQHVEAVFDCDTGRRADLGPGATLAEDGSVQGVTWHDTGLDDPVTRAACTEG